MGFLAVTVLAVAAVLHASRSGSADAVEDDPAKLKLPALAASPRDEQLPALLSADAASPDIESLGKGGVLLVFSDGTPGPGAKTAKLAVEMHRRLRPFEVRVVLVVPREALSSDPAADDATLRDGLRRLGVAGDIAVLPDPADERAPGRLRRGRWRFADRNGAMLLRDGIEWMHVTPPAAADGLLRAHLAPLVVVAKSLGAKPADVAPGGGEPPATPK